ncbi:hypothetical protein IFM89_039210 [Coptis chinensis]|uniref:RRM domain-containing protein n=1 Tax=Coptis chinensis TaxID=261450 RepID=A0A835LLP8_9MAGN|nr:hypothetical protein IFM89_039210 [Coptis chinensis]
MAAFRGIISRVLFARNTRTADPLNSAPAQLTISFPAEELLRNSSLEVISYVYLLLFSINFPLIICGIIFSSSFDFSWALDLAWPYVSIFGAIAGLSFYTTEEALSESFSQFGQVIEGAVPQYSAILNKHYQRLGANLLVLAAKIISDRVSDRSKGFGFITFASEDEAQKACEEMNGKVLNGRVIYVDTAKPSRTGYSNGMPIARGPPEPVHH